MFDHTVLHFFANVGLIEQNRSQIALLSSPAVVFLRDGPLELNFPSPEYVLRPPLPQ